MKTFKTYRVLNAALGMSDLSDKAFRILYYICNNLSFNNVNRAEIERVSIAVRIGLWDDESGKQLKKQLDKITKYTDELVEKGLLVKDVIFDRNTCKRKTFYAIPESFLEEKLNNDGQKLNGNSPKRGVTKKDQNIQNTKNTQKDQNTHKNSKTDEEFCQNGLDDAEEELFGSCAIDPKDYDDENLPF